MDRFPDGQLYLDLRGSHPDRCMPVHEAARNLLVALVPAKRIPAGVDARTAMLRTVLAGRRILLVLDNARDAGHVRPLLPGAGCTVVITSRDRLLGLIASHGATLLPLEPLTADEARQLLVRRLGAARVTADRSSVDAVVAATAGLPLAVVTMAAHAAAGISLAAVAKEQAAPPCKGSAKPGVHDFPVRRRQPGSVVRSS